MPVDRLLVVLYLPTCIPQLNSMNYNLFMFIVLTQDHCLGITDIPKSIFYHVALLGRLQCPHVGTKNVTTSLFQSEVRF